MKHSAVITISKSNDIKNSEDIGLYFCWNGRRDAVEAALTYCEFKRYKGPSYTSYGWARLYQVIGSSFCDSSDNTSIGLGMCCDLDCDNGYNGVYIIKGWKIVGRQYIVSAEQRSHKLLDTLIYIDSKQPATEQLGEELITTLYKERCERRRRHQRHRHNRRSLAAHLHCSDRK